MYPRINDIVTWAKNSKARRPLILCEYSHTMGNSNGSLADYWQAFESNHGLQVGFLWEWVDHGIRQVAPNGESYWAYGGDFGDVPNDVNFCTDGIVWPDRTPHPGLYEFKKLAQPFRVQAIDLKHGQIRVVNKHDFINLDWLYGEWELTVDGVAVASGKLPPLRIAPGESLEVTIDAVANAKTSSGERFLNFHFYQQHKTDWAAAGHEVGWEQLALDKVPQRAAPKRKTLASSNVIVEDTPTRIVLRVGDTQAAFDRTSGTLVEFGAKGENFIQQGPRFNVWRAATDNDGIKLRSKPEPCVLLSWLALGLDQLKYTVHHVSLIQNELPEVEIVHQTCCRDCWVYFQHIHLYQLLPSVELLFEIMF